MKKQKLIIIIAICAFVIVTVEVLINIFFPEIFQNFEWYGKVAMALLITLILVLTVRSYASITGTYLTYSFQINGAIVIFCLVFASSFTREIFFNNYDFNFSVQVINFNAKVMPKNIEVFFLEGTYKPTFKVDETGIADFLNIQSKFKGKQVKFQMLNSDGYTISENTSFAIIDNQKTISIKLERNDFIVGRVIDKDFFPVDSAVITIDELDTTIYSSSNGIFKLKVPEAEKQNVYSLSIKKNKNETSGEVSLNASSDFMINNQ